MIYKSFFNYFLHSGFVRTSLHQGRAVDDWHQHPKIDLQLNLKLMHTTCEVPPSHIIFFLQIHFTPKFNPIIICHHPQYTETQLESQISFWHQFTCSLLLPTPTQPNPPVLILLNFFCSKNMEFWVLKKFSVGKGKAWAHFVCFGKHMPVLILLNFFVQRTWSSGY